MLLPASTPSELGVEQRPFKHVCRLVYGEALKAEERASGNIRVFGSNGAIGKHDCSNTLGPCLIVGRKGSFGKVAYSEDPCFVIDTAYYIDRNSTGENIDWLYYALSSLQLDSISKDSAVPGLSRTDAYSRLVPWCPPDYQKSIERFLRWYDARVNRLVRAKRRQIALLTEQKQAIIQQAVTRGLDPDAPMKPSGVEWLGEIPAHWRILRNGALFSLRRELGAPELPILEVSLRTGVTVRNLDQSSENRKQMMSDLSGYQVARQGDIAYNMMRMWQGATGVTPTDGLVSPAYIVLRPNQDVDSEYYAHLYRTTPFMTEVNRWSRGIVKDRNRLYWADYKQMPVPVPPKDEQMKIIGFLQLASNDVDQATNRITREIDLIREYRTRLVADVVTGQLDVRAAAAALPDVDPLEGAGDDAGPEPDDLTDDDFDPDAADDPDEMPDAAD